MKARRATQRPAAKPRAALLLAAFLLAVLVLGPARATPTLLRQQNEALFSQMELDLGLSDAQMAVVREIFARSGYIGQGNPEVTVHPMTPAECRQRAAAYDGPTVASGEFEKICGAKFMAPLYDPSRETAAEASVCIDQYEFPDLPCVYPVVWVRVREAAELCEAEGKRICDAHEWEGACAGSLEPPDYRFDLAKGVDPATAVARMRAASNRVHAAHPVWSYGPAYRTGICATGSSKTAGCNGGGWRGCGSNTYPAGSFPACQSPLGVYDLNGNAAEQMNLPLDPSQMASRGSKTLGVTEMKGSWFVFDTFRAHQDDCRWRAPYWHGSRVLDTASHQNYHLGFRCCKTLHPDASTPEPPRAKSSSGTRGPPRP